MPLIAHKYDPSGLTRPKLYKVKAGVNFHDWLCNEFGTSNEMCGDLACTIILNGKSIFESDADNIDESILNFTIGETDQITIVNRPKGVVAVVAIIISVVAIAVSIYAYLNTPKLPGQAEGRSESPNNKLNAASNEFRPNEAIPECFGYGVSYPDFIQPSYYYYENNIKRQVGLFCISAGEVAVPEVRVGETNINSIPGSDADVYPPGVNPPSEFLTIHQFSQNIDGQILLAPNDPEIVRSGLSFSIGTDDIGVTGYIIMDGNIARDLALETGGYMYINVTSVINEYVPITLVEYSQGGGGELLATITFNTTTSLPTSPSSVTGTIARATSESVVDNYIGWFDIPGKDAKEIWFHWRAPLGVRNSEGDSVTLQVEMQIEALDGNGAPTGLSWTKTESITKNTLDPQFITTRFTPEENPGMTRTQYRARVRRLTSVIDSSQNASEKLEVEAILSVTPYSQPNFGDVTLLLIQRKATLLGSDQAGQKINCDYRRKLPTYDRNTNTYNLNLLTETNSFADAASYTLIARGTDTVDTVDLQELYGINDNLSSSDLGEFTFTFDDANVSSGERIEAICNVARTVVFHDGYTWRFNRDEIKPISGALFNRRSLVGNNGAQAWQPQRSDDSDSVRIVYVDDESNTEAYIDRRFDIGTGTIVSGEVGAVVKEIKLAGCRNVFQATNRAELEIRRIAYQRRTVKDTTYRDALSIDLLDRVGWVDINDLDVFDGEILGINGSIYDTTERFEPVDGRSYVAFVTDSEGYPSNTVTCSPRTDTEFGFIANGINGAYLASGDQQLSSRYFIADADDLAASLYTLKSRTPSPDGTVQVELTEYDPRMFEKDDIEAPAGKPILNDGLIAQDVAQNAATTASLIFNSDGTIDLEDFSALWFDGGVNPGIGDEYEIKAELVTGATPAGTLNSWVPISSATWSLSASATPESINCQLTISIRQIDVPENAVTNTISINAVNASLVALPTTLSVNGVINGGNGFASVSINSDGSYSTSEGVTGLYTTQALRVGRYYEARATNVMGDIPLDNADQWIELTSGGATFRIDSGVEATTAFDVEVREVANIANTDSVAVTLGVTVI